MNAVLSTSISMHYEVSGQGPPLILLAGTSMDHQAWGFQTPAYAPHFTTVSVDNRGAGRSDAPPDPSSYSAAVMAESHARDTVAAYRHGRGASPGARACSKERPP